MSTYKELCSIANDLNQPDLIYKFMHLANHNAMWNSRKVHFICMKYLKKVEDTSTRYLITSNNYFIGCGLWI